MEMVARKQELVSVGESSLLAGEVEKAAWAFDSSLYLTPGQRDPRMWQRGLACFYGARYEDGRKQFEADMDENGSDIEEVLWHFLCRCKLNGYHGAKSDGFLSLKTHDHLPPPPPPMRRVLQLYRGEATVEDVFKAASNPDGSPAKSYNDTNALAYANFYTGLLYEVQGDLVSAARYLKVAAELRNPDYMGKLMNMHFQLINKKVSPLHRLMMSSRLAGAVSTSTSKFPCVGKIVQGGWQLSSGHRSSSDQLLSKSDIVGKLLKSYDSGVRVFDCGDIYTGVEDLYGAMIKALHQRGVADDSVKIFTKLIPDLDVIQAGKVDETYVRAVVRRSLNRLGIDRVCLVQFHWWDYDFPGYMAALDALHRLVGEGAVEHIGLTNFDTDHTREIIERGIPIISTQVQYSLLDRRPLHSGLIDLCEQHGVQILAYGVLAGGFLTDTWVGAQRPLKEELSNRSLTKYLLIIDEFGGWERYQRLLSALRGVANRHSNRDKQFSVAMVAIQYVLSQRQVGGVIIGTRDEKYLESTIAATTLQLTKEDFASVESVLSSASGPSGPVYGLEREREGRHGEIMKYNLNCVNQSAHLEELCTRYLRLRFEACPTDATRTGYRLPPPQDYFTTCADVSSRHFDYDKTLLHAAKAVSYDHFLTISSSREIADYCKKVRAVLTEAEGIDESLPDPEQLVDLKLIISQLKLELVRWEKVKVHKKDPGFYLPMNDLLYLLPAWGPEISTSTDTESLSMWQSLSECTHPGVVDMTVDERLLALHSRLKRVPTLLLNAHENLTEPILEYVKTAVGICGSFAKFLRETLPRLSRLLASLNPQTITSYDNILSDIAMMSSVAADCVEEFAKYLQNDILPQSSKASGIGRETYDEILKYEHFIDSSKELLKLGEGHFHQVKRELESLASEIDPKRTWQEITEQDINTKHPTADELLQAYLKEIERARRHMIAHDLVSQLPPEEKVLGFSTPKFLEPFSPVGDYLNPSPFVGMGKRDSAPSQHDSAYTQSQYRIGHLMLHSIKDRCLPKPAERKLLRCHDYSWIAVVSPHESYPGHHVQALLTQQNTRVLRKFHESILFYEGWGLYTEELAYETGFFETDREYTEEETGELKTIPATDFAKLTRLTQLRLRLWRAARIILDVKLNRGEMAFEECREFLLREVKFNEGASQGEVFMYLSRPGYASCYVAGFVLLMELREEMRKRCLESGGTFKLKNFHDLVLSKGCIPFKLLRTLI